MTTADTFQLTTVHELAEMVRRAEQKCPELAARAADAAALVLRGYVEQTARHAGHVRSSGKDEFYYEVDVTADADGCACKDYQHRGIAYKDRKYCKHVLALMFLEELQRRAGRHQASRREQLATYRPHQARRPIRRTGGRGLRVVA